MADQIKKAMTDAGVTGNARRRIRRAYNNAEQKMVDDLASILGVDVELLSDDVLKIGDTEYDEVQFTQYVNSLPRAKQEKVYNALMAYRAALSATFRKNA